MLIKFKHDVMLRKSKHLICLINVAVVVKED